MKSLKKALIYFTTLILITSCIQDLDFDQINDFSLTPVFEGSLIGFSFTPRQFFDASGTLQTERTDTTGFFIFENDFIRKNLIRVEFNVEIINTIDNDFSIQIDFLDQNNNSTHTFKEIILNGNDDDFKFTETIDISPDSEIKNTSQLRITARVTSSNPPLDPSDINELLFKSSAKLFIRTNG